MAELILISDTNKEVTSHVIFIHGLGGDAHKTWQCSADADVCWLKWLAEDIAGLSVWTVGYDAAVSRWRGSAMHLVDRATNILERILLEPRLKSGEITLIGHSLGGLVIKQLLRDAATKAHQRNNIPDFISRVRQVAFLATPHSGSDQASWGDKLRFFIRPSAATTCLVRNDPNLRDLNNWYRLWVPRQGITHLIMTETRSISIVGMIVKPDSSDPGLPSLSVPIGADHVTICKPSDRTSEIYLHVREFLGAEHSAHPAHNSSLALYPELQEKPEDGGLRGILPRVYHPLFLGRETNNRQDDDKNKPQEMPDTGWWESRLPVVGFERIDEDQVFQEWVYGAGSGVYLILGEPGSGKSTLLAQWSRRSKNNDKVVKQTVWLDLGKATPDALKQLAGLNNRHLLILLDSWDEASDAVQTKLKALLPDLMGIVIINCRSAVYRGEFDQYLKSRKPYHVMGLRADDQKIFLQDLAKVWRESNNTDLAALGFSLANETWCETLWQAIQAHPQIKRLAGSPLLLTLLAYMHPPPEVTCAQLPDNKLAFYERAFDWLCKNRIDKNVSKKTVNELKQFLVFVVNETTFNDDLDELHLRAVFEGRFKAAYGNCDYDFEQVEAYLEATGLLKKSHASGSYRFLHKSFQEWLLATALYSGPKLVNSVKEYWQDTNYRNTLALMWSLATTTERHSATNYLIGQGCQCNPHALGEYNRNDSGLRTAIHLWNDSGLEVGSETLSVLEQHVCVGSLRKYAVAIDTSTCGALLSVLAKDDDSEVRRAVARNGNTSAELLALLAKDDDRWVRGAVAGNGNASAELLALLAKNDGSQVRVAVAGNANTSAEVLALLAKDDGREVRGAVAHNGNTSTEVLAMLAKDNDSGVRGAVAQNANTSAEVLALFAKDDDREVRGVVAQHGNTSTEVLALLAKDNDREVRQTVAYNVNTSAEVLVMLAKDDDSGVRQTVAYNVNTSAEVLVMLAKDDDSEVRGVVAYNANACLEWLVD